MNPAKLNNAEQVIRWGEPVNGLRLGARFEGANDPEAMQFRYGDRAHIELYLQNVSDQETECGFDPADLCKWQQSRGQDSDKQQPDEILRIKQHNGEVVNPVPPSESDGSGVIFRVAALSTNYGKMLPQESRRLDGHKAATD